MSTPKLPKGLPKLPPVRVGYSKWSRPRKGPCSIPIDCPVAMWHEARKNWTIDTGVWQGNDAECWYAVAIRAVKRPAKKPKSCGAPMSAGDKFRSWEKPHGHKGKHAAHLGGVMTEDESPKPARKGRVVARRGIMTEAGVRAAYFVLPADAESVERMVIECGNAIFADRDKTGSNHQSQARAALAAIGIATKGGGVS